MAQQEHFQRLDGLRGVAALVVMIGHATNILAGHSIVPRKLLAVDFFFMLSGFVIAYAYERKILAGMTVRAFLVRRAIRLYPLIALGAVLGICATAIDVHFRFPATAIPPVIGALLALPVPGHHFGSGLFPINPPEWSLFYELLAYIAFVLFLVRSRTAFVGLIAVVALVARLWSDIRYGIIWPPFWTDTFSVTYAFSFGVILWRIRDKAKSIRLPFLALVLLVMAPCFTPLSLGWPSDAVGMMICFPLAILSGATISQGVSAKAESLLGDLSYPLYVLHWPVIQIVRRALPADTGLPASVVLACAAAIAVSFAALARFDKPVRMRLSASYASLGNSRLKPEASGRC